MDITKFNSNFVYANSIFFWQIFSLTVCYLILTYAFKTNEFQVIHLIYTSAIGLVIGLLTAHLIVLTYRQQKSIVHDPLTLAFNRAYFMRKLNRWCEARICFSLIIFDVDYFSRINSAYGNNDCDDILIRLSSLVKRTKRAHDIFSRHGDGKFVLMVARSNLASATKIASRLCEAISRTSMPSDIHLTCSFGVAQFNPDDDAPDTVLKRANNALSKSKSNGRNCVSAVQTEIISPELESSTVS